VKARSPIPHARPNVEIVRDVSRLAADLAAVESLARDQLAARRRGCRLRLRDASLELVELLDLCGLDYALGARGQPEEGEEAVGVEEVVEADDPPAGDVDHL
jgi:hypothetical protein